MSNSKKKKQSKQEEEAKLIFSPQLANYLLHCGFEITNLKPKRGTDGKESVFVFRNSGGIYDCIEDWMDKKEKEDSLNKDKNELY